MIEIKKIKALAIVTALFLCSTNLSAQDTLHLTIDKALQIALSDNMNIKIADAELERVDYLKKESWYALLPSLNGSATYTNNIYKQIFFSDFFPGGSMEVGSTHSYAMYGSFSAPLFSFSLYKNIELSGIEIKAALESARTTKLDLIKQVKNSFYGIIMTKESLKVLEQSYKNAMESAGNIKDKYDQGVASEYDKIRSEVAARNIMPTLTQTRNGLELAKLQLKILLSLNLNTPVEVDGDLSDVEQQISNYEKNIAFSFENNSNLKSMNIQLEKLNKNFDIIHAQRLPSVSLVSTYTIQKQSEQFSLRHKWPNSLSAGLQITLPIFNKLSVSLKEKEVKVGIRQMEYQKNLLEQNLSLSARNSVNEMERAKIQLFSDKEAVKQATKGYEIAKVRYNTGVGTVLELNDTEVALTQSKLNLNQTLYNFLKAKNELETVLGEENISK